MLLGTAVVLALLAIPVTLRFDVAWDRTLRQDVRLLWAFGLVRVKLAPRGAKARERDAEGEMPAREKPRTQRAASKRKRKHKRNVLGGLRLARFRRRILRFAGDLWRAVRKEDLSLRVRLGLGDPADTGRLWAVLGPVAGWLATLREASVTIEPEFFEPTLELETHGSISVTPLKILGLLAALSLSPAVWQGLRAMRARG
jgi:hypothetical protein